MALASCVVHMARSGRHVADDGGDDRVNETSLSCDNRSAIKSDLLDVIRA